MHDLMYKVFEIMNQIKGFTVGYSAHENKLLFEKDNKLYIMECREVDQSYTKAPKDIYEAMRRIKYL